MSIANKAYDAAPLPVNFPLTQVKPLSILQEPSIEYIDCEYVVNVSSMQRDTSVYPYPNQYKIHFDNTYKNVRSIELISIILPNKSASGSINAEPYISMKIEEFSNFVDGTFATFPLKGPVDSTSSSFIIPELACTFNSPKIFKTPLASLASLTISLRDCTGALFNFGAPNADVTKAYQNYFVFKITVEEKARKPLRRRNVY